MAADFDTIRYTLQVSETYQTAFGNHPKAFKPTGSPLQPDSLTCTWLWLLLYALPFLLPVNLDLGHGTGLDILILCLWFFFCFTSASFLHPPKWMCITTVGAEPSALHFALRNRSNYTTFNGIYQWLIHSRWFTSESKTRPRNLPPPEE